MGLTLLFCFPCFPFIVTKVYHIHSPLYIDILHKVHALDLFILLRPSYRLFNGPLAVFYLAYILTMASHKNGTQRNQQGKREEDSSPFPCLLIRALLSECHHIHIQTARDSESLCSHAGKYTHARICYKSQSSLLSLW